MSIQSTAYITREHAIDRITDMAEMFISQNYRKIQAESFDPDIDIHEFVDNWEPSDVDNLENWTDEMLGDYMDNPFFRHSMFNNYLIEDEE